MTLVSDVLFGYQVEAAERIAEQSAILLADQPGLGKTLEVLGGLEVAGLFNKPSNILILTPIINAKTTWIDTLYRFIAPRYNITVIDLSKGSAKQKAKQLESAGLNLNFYVANHNAIDVTKNGMRVDISGILWDAVIVDESHLVLPITGPKLTQFWRGLNRLKTYSGTKRIAISGTPDRGKLENRFGTWSFLYPEIVGSNKYKWLEENFFMVEQRVSRDRTIKVPYTLKDERKWQLFSSKWMIRRTKAEVLTQLPPKRYVDVELEMSDKQKLQYFKAQLEYEETLRNAEDESNASSMIFALRSRQLATCSWTDDYSEPVVGGESVKWEWLKEWLDTRGFIEADDMADNSAKVVIVSQFSKTLHWLKKELALVGIAADVLDGSASVTSRSTIQERFQRGDLRVVLLSGTMGVGINLDRADDLIMVDSPYDPDRIEQIEDRIHRASNMHNVTIWNLIALHTIDQAIAEKVSKRYHITRKLLDQSRGVEIGRNVLARIRKVRDGQENSLESAA
jgi:SNF2 family DNA or RNA helicase